MLSFFFLRGMGFVEVFPKDLFLDKDEDFLLELLDDLLDRGVRPDPEPFALDERRLSFFVTSCFACGWLECDDLPDSIDERDSL